MLVEKRTCSSAENQTLLSYEKKSLSVLIEMVNEISLFLLKTFAVSQPVWKTSTGKVSKPTTMIDRRRTVPLYVLRTFEKAKRRKNSLGR